MNESNFVLWGDHHQVLENYQTDIEEIHNGLLQYDKATWKTKMKGRPQAIDVLSSDGMTSSDTCLIIRSKDRKKVWMGHYSLTQLYDPEIYSELLASIKKGEQLDVLSFNMPHMNLFSNACKKRGVAIHSFYTIPVDQNFYVDTFSCDHYIVQNWQVVSSTLAKKIFIYYLPEEDKILIYSDKFKYKKPDLIHGPGLHIAQNVFQNMAKRKPILFEAILLTREKKTVSIDLQFFEEGLATYTNKFMKKYPGAHALSSIFPDQDFVQSLGVDFKAENQAKYQIKNGFKFFQSILKPCLSSGEVKEELQCSGLKH